MKRIKCKKHQNCSLLVSCSFVSFVVVFAFFSFATATKGKQKRQNTHSSCALFFSAVFIISFCEWIKIANVNDRGARRSMHMILSFISWMESAPVRQMRCAHTRSLPNWMWARTRASAHTHKPEMVITAWYTLLCDSGDNNFSLLWSSARRKAVLWEVNSFVYFSCLFASKCCQVQIIHSELISLRPLLWCFSGTLVHRTLAVFFFI